VKGSRVSVIQGEVRVSHDNQEQVLQPGQQTVSGPSLEPLPVSEDIAWSRNVEQHLATLGKALAAIKLPPARYSSRLLARLPASTVFFASVPNLEAYLGQARSLIRERAGESPELESWFQSSGVGAVLEKIRAGSTYLGDEVVVAAEQSRRPVLLAEVRRGGFPEFLKQQAPMLAIVERPGLVIFGPDRAAVESLSAGIDSSSFDKTPFFARIAEAYRDGVALLLCADLGHFNGTQQEFAPRYLVARYRQDPVEVRTSLGFEGKRAGMAAWLAPPSPIGALDYVSPEATVLGAFAVSAPSGICDQLSSALGWSPEPGLRGEIAASLGGEFAVALDGPPFPVPSWKVIAEVYDVNRLQAAIRQDVENYNRTAPSPLRTSQETVDGRTYYSIATANGNALTAAQYTFDDGYLVAAPSRALLLKALQAKTTGAGVARAPAFQAMLPRDRFANFSGVIYQNLGTTLAPLTGILGALIPNRSGEGQVDFSRFGDMKPSMVIAYGEPDRITIAARGDLFGLDLGAMAGGNVLQLGSVLPIGPALGTLRPKPAYR
jgi:hypothetical protein